MRATRSAGNRGTLQWVISALGYGLLLAYIVQGYAVGQFAIPAPDLAAYIRAGDALRSGSTVYTAGLAQGGAFLYAPTWAVIWALLSWLPAGLLQALVSAAELLSLRYLAGSWRAVGYLGWLPLTAFELVSGNINLLIAAAIYAAWRYSAAPLALAALAKLSPLLALPVGRWREFAIALLIGVAITIPWLGLWPAWMAFLLRQPAVAGNVIPIPWLARLPVAALLLLLRRPWGVALAAIVAIPALWWTSVLMLLAPLRLWWEDRNAGRSPRWV